MKLALLLLLAFAIVLLLPRPAPRAVAQRAPDLPARSAVGTLPEPERSPRLPGRVAPAMAALTRSPDPVRTSPAPVAAAESAGPRGAAPTLRPVVFSGIASTYGPSYGPEWVAIPLGPGYRIRVCGPASCVRLLTTDQGPDQRVYPERVVDLPTWAFERVSGQSWRRGIVPVSVVIEGGK